MTEPHQSPHYQRQDEKSFNSDQEVRVPPPFGAGMVQWGALVPLCALKDPEMCGFLAERA